MEWNNGNLERHAGKEKYELSKQFISQHSGFMSMKETNLISKEVPIIQEVKEVSWSSLTSPKNQIMFLEVYCHLKAKEFNFSSELTKSLIESVIYSVFVKDITSNDIEMKNGVISNISAVFINR